MTPKHFLGAASEHEAAAWYLQRGVEVFWPAVQQSWTDFLIFDGSFRRVQVKTAWWNASTKFHYLQCRLRDKVDRGPVVWKDRFDLLFLIGAGRRWIIPAEAIDSSNICVASTNPKPRPTRWDGYQQG